MTDKKFSFSVKSKHKKSKILRHIQNSKFQLWHISKSTDELPSTIVKKGSNLISCSPDPTTNSENTTPKFYNFFDHLELVLQVFFVYGLVCLFVKKSFVA